MGKLISGSLRYVSKMTLDQLLKFPFLRNNVTITVAGTTQQNLLFLIVGFLKNRMSVVDIMNPKLEESALPFSEIQERMFKLHKLNPWMFVRAP